MGQVIFIDRNNAVLKTCKKNHDQDHDQRVFNPGFGSSQLGFDCILRYAQLIRDLFVLKIIEVFQPKNLLHFFRKRIHYNQYSPIQFFFLRTKEGIQFRKRFINEILVQNTRFVGHLQGFQIVDTPVPDHAVNVRLKGGCDLDLIGILPYEDKYFLHDVFTKRLIV